MMSAALRVLERDVDMFNGSGINVTKRNDDVSHLLTTGINGGNSDDSILVAVA